MVKLSCSTGRSFKECSKPSDEAGEALSSEDLFIHK